MLYYVYFHHLGQPRAGLAPRWLSLRSAGQGLDKLALAPAIAEIGGGWYRFDLRYGVEPWSQTAEDLVGVIDGGVPLETAERYRPVAISLRGLGLARIAHRGVQDKATGRVTIYGGDGVTPELHLEMTETAGTIERQPARGGCSWTSDFNRRCSKAISRRA